MAYQRVPNGVEIRVLYTLDDANFMNTFHAVAAGGYNLSMLQDLANRMDFNYATAMKAVLSKDVNYVQTEVRGLDSEFDLTVTVTLSAGACSVVSRSFPANVAFAVTRRSGLTGRSARGRVYVGGIPVTYQEGDPLNQNNLTVTAANGYVAVVDGARITIDNTVGFDPVIVSRYHNGLKRAEAVTFAWVSTDAKNRRLDTQRNRIR